YLDGNHVLLLVDANRARKPHLLQQPRHHRVRQRSRAARQGDANPGFARTQPEHPAGAGVEDLYIEILAIDTKLCRGPIDRLLDRPPARVDLLHFFFVPLGRCGNNGGETFTGASPPAGTGPGRPTTMKYSSMYTSVDTIQEIESAIRKLRAKYATITSMKRNILACCGS